MDTREQHLPATTTSPLLTPTRRFVMAWAVMVGGLVGFWCCRPWLGTRAFNYGQLAVLMLTWKIASLLCLPPEAWARFTPPQVAGLLLLDRDAAEAVSRRASGPPPAPQCPRFTGFCSMY